ncbi:sigma 54-interacting transcriptional regulator [Olsenella sp. AGMB03486]|uniref:sigma 54-interacting transcriptional regulator n=1 Tax=Olsenella sp. AGMB03486 TaxID=3230364 RepID=UPI00349FFC71
MKRIEVIYQRLTKAGEEGCTASALASVLGLARANVSSDLNQLCRENRAYKTGSRPVFYHPVKTGDAISRRPAGAAGHTDPFAETSIRYPSLFHCVEQAKAAALYPPHGMNMLIRGATGVGKTTFAKLVYDYSVYAGILDSDAPFIAFNCADYADNPQLLVSQLMGSVRGAYTGAEENREGLLAQADNGILFLDEVHRLPPQGQEMLFTFMDRGVYRRLGETDAEHRAKVMLICATTEDPSSTLLKTFMRRIPMVIEIPALSERSRKERFNYIAAFFLDESERLGMPIFVSVNSLRGLLAYSCPSNVGQLKSDIKLLCAGAYSRLQSHQTARMEISGRHLPENIREGMYAATSREEVWLPYLAENRRFCVFDAQKEQPSDIPSSAKPAGQHESIYDLIDRKYLALKNEGLDEEEITSRINDIIRSYFSGYVTRSAKTTFAESVIDSEALTLANEILDAAAKSLDRTFSENIRFGVAGHISGAISRVERGLAIHNPQLDDIRKNHPREFSAALTALRTIQSHYSVELPLDEAGFLALFMMPIERHHDSIPLIVVIAHGPATATSMVETANYLQGANLAVGINASLNESPSQVYMRLLDLVRTHMPQAGVLLMVDMGSLSEFGTSLTRDTGIPCKVFQLVSTMHIVEAERKASLGFSLDEVYDAAASVNEILGPQRPALAADASQSHQVSRAFIVTVCTTSEGGAQMLKDLFDSRLNYHNGFCETIALALQAKESIAERLEALSKAGTILCGASTFAIDYPIPWYSPSDIIAGNAIQDIQERIEEALVISKTRDALSELIDSYNVKAAFPLFLDAISSIEHEGRRSLASDTEIGVLCHLSYLVDRIKKGEGLDVPQTHSSAAEDPALYHAVLASLTTLEQKLQIAIPQQEAGNICAFFSPENCRQA